MPAISMRADVADDSFPAPATYFHRFRREDYCLKWVDFSGPQVSELHVILRALIYGACMIAFAAYKGCKY
jgi:hypothetical protein